MARPTSLRGIALALWLGMGLAACIGGQIGGGGDDAASGGGGDPGGGSSADGGGDEGGASQGGGDPGGGPMAECQDAADCPGLDGDCAARSCVGGECGIANAALGDDCDEGGGVRCDGMGSCVECIEAADCSNGICQANQCVPATCNDGVQNGDESAIDCGGSCAACGNGLDCNGAIDCVSGYCNNGTCAACGNDGHCASGSYCNAGVCADKKIAGDLCSAPNQCQSGFCPAADGVCCGSACTAGCQACVSGKTGQANGVCDNVSFGIDPDGECPNQGAASCDANGTGCNGAGACRLYPAGTQCAAPSCMSGQQTLASQCNGSGTCQGGAQSACSPYICGSQACLTSCGGNGDCQSGYECQSMSCTQPGCQGAGPSTTPLDSEEQAFLVLINNHRANNGLGPLTPCTSLNRAAQGHSEDMRDNNYFSHTGLNNSTFVTRSCAACYTHACPLSTSMGENIAAGNTGAAGTFNQWLNSPPHNANMLGASYTRIGIGRATGGMAMYAAYWTNVFAGANETSCN